MFIDIIVVNPMIHGHSTEKTHYKLLYNFFGDMKDSG